MSEVRRFICIRCPKGCDVDVTYEGGKVLSAEGHQCEEGVGYVTEEIENPVRTLTTTVRVRGGDAPLAAVRTAEPIPRGRLMEAMRELADVVAEAPLAMGDVISEDVAGTGVRVVVTRGVGAVR